MAKGGETAKNLGLTEKQYKKLKKSKKQSMAKRKDKARTTGKAVGSGKDWKDHLKELEKRFGKDKRVDTESEASEINKAFDEGVKVGKKMKKKQMGGRVNPSMDPRFSAQKQGIKYMEHGGEVSTSNDKAVAGDIHTVHTHSGYKAGK